MPLVVQALRELFAVHAQVRGELERPPTGVADGIAAHVLIVEVPPVPLIAGAFGRQRRELGLGAEDDEMPVLELGQSGLYDFCDDLRLSLSREASAGVSLKVRILDDRDRSVRIAHDVPLSDEARAMSAEYFNHCTFVVGFGLCLLRGDRGLAVGPFRRFGRAGLVTGRRLLLVIALRTAGCQHHTSKQGHHCSDCD